jgi:hypothetical protein
MVMFERGGIMVVVAVLGALLWAAPATAIVTPRDIASTHAYIRADYALNRATEAKVAAAQAGVVALNRKLGQTCPKAGAGGLEDEASQPLSYEVAVAMWSVSYGTDAGPIDAFLATVSRLRWSEGRLTRITHSYAQRLHQMATLPMPDLCGDVSAWKASGFRTIPPETTRLDKYEQGIEPKSVSPRLLAPYEQPADKGILARTTGLEAKLEETEISLGLSDWDRILETLGLNQ